MSDDYYPRHATMTRATGAEMTRLEDSSMSRHPVFLNRLGTDDYYPISVVPISKLIEGDIIDMRDFDREVPEDRAFLIIDDIERDEFGGIISLSGKLNDGTLAGLEQNNELAMYRRKVVRYALRHHI